MSIARLMQMGAAGNVPSGPVWTDPDLANASYDAVSFSVAAQEVAPRSLFFKTDGTKMYVLGEAGRDINEYNLSTSWDVSTASFVQTFSVSAQDTSPLGLFFRYDGLKVYVVGNAGDNVNEYNLSTAWDVSTATYLQNFSVAAQETAPNGLSFKPDGTKMYVTGTTGDDVNEYNLSTAWDVSTASFVQLFSVASQDTAPSSVKFNPDGTKMYVNGIITDSLYEYNLSTAWDVSTASFVQSFVFTAQEAAPQSFFFKPDGSKMYMVGVSSDTIYQYSTA